MFIAAFRAKDIITFCILVVGGQFNLISITNFWTRRISMDYILTCYRIALTIDIIREPGF